MADSNSSLKKAFDGILALAACYLAWSAASEAHFSYLRASDVAAAHAARPLDAESLVRFVDARMRREVGTFITALEAEAARAALIKEPLSRAVLRILGWKAEIDGDMTRADAAFSISDALSRRDALTQLWLIERSVGKNDIGGAVRHYHAALSVHPELGPVLYPVLGKAIAYPEVRHALAPYVRRKTPWIGGMLTLASSHGNPADVAELGILASVGLRDKVYSGISANVMTRLANQADFSLAKRFAKAVVPGLDTDKLNNFGTSEAIIDPRLGAMGWSLTEEGQILTSINSSDGFDVDIEPLANGVIASRTFPTAGGGHYLFRQSVRGEEGVQGSFSWQVACIPSREIIWRQILPRLSQTQHLEWQITVPADCKGLSFALIGRGPEGQRRAQATFEALDLRLRVN